MKAKSLILSLVVGVLAALPAQAGSGLIKITRATHVQTSASTVAKAQRTVSQARSEFKSLSWPRGHCSQRQGAAFISTDEQEDPRSVKNFHVASEAGGTRRLL